TRRSAATRSSGSSTGRADWKRSSRPEPLAQLAGRAVPRAASGDARLLDRRAAPRAGLAATTVDLELVLHRAARTVRLSVVAQRGSLALYACFERALDSFAERLHLVGPELASRRQRVDPRAPERLVDVDVPEAGQRPLVEQGSLHGSFAIGELRGERLRRERAAERLPPQTRSEAPRRAARYGFSSSGSTRSHVPKRRTSR